MKVHPRDRFWRVVIPLGLFAVLTTMVVVGWAVEPARFVVGYAPKQPIPFSHRVHAGNNRIPCPYCHTNADRSRHATVPAVQTCMNCHRAIKLPNNNKYIATAVIKPLKSDARVTWKRVYHLPDYVFFDHRSHVDVGVQCQTCHGRVENTDVTTRVMNMRMGQCLSCHRNPSRYLPTGSKVKHGPTDCTAFHR